MRHLWSLLAGVVAAPLAWLCLAAGQYQSSRSVAEWNEENFFDTAELIGPAAFLAAAGILLGLVGTLRWSPAGPTVAGLLLVVPTIFMFINPFDTREAFNEPERLVGQDMQPWLPVENGTLLVLGALLLMAVFSAQRWRRWPAAAGLTATGTAVPITGAAAAPVTEQPPPAPMTDDEILAAAADMEEQEKAGASASVEEPAEPATEPKAEAEPEPEPDNDESSTKSGTSAKS
jgi:hypothetical protein